MGGQEWVPEAAIFGVGGWPLLLQREGDFSCDEEEALWGEALGVSPFPERASGDEVAS